MVTSYMKSPVMTIEVVRKNLAHFSRHLRFENNKFVIALLFISNRKFRHSKFFNCRFPPKKKRWEKNLNGLRRKLERRRWKRVAVLHRQGQRISFLLCVFNSWTATNLQCEKEKNTQHQQQPAWNERARKKTKRLEEIVKTIKVDLCCRWCSRWMRQLVYAFRLESFNLKSRFVPNTHRDLSHDCRTIIFVPENFFGFFLVIKSIIFV